MLEFETKTRQEEKVERLQQENARLASEARLALQHRDEFLAHASHELKTPLTSMLLQAQLLLQTEPERLSEERVRKCAAFFERQLLRINGLVDEMLSASRLEFAPLSLRWRPTDLSALVLSACEQLEPAFRKSCTELRLHIPEGITGNLDEGRLEQLLTNLLTNALKYAPGKPVDVSMEQKGDLAVLSVRDQGTGVPPEHQERIFERFERAAAPEHTSGLGLGLFIARTIAEAHGGRLYVSPERGAGANFIVELPIRQPTIAL